MQLGARKASTERIVTGNMKTFSDLRKRHVGATCSHITKRSVRNDLISGFTPTTVAELITG